MRRIVLALAMALAPIGGAVAAEVSQSGVSVDGVNASLLLPAKPHGAIILMAGGDGQIGWAATAA